MRRRSSLSRAAGAGAAVALHDDVPQVANPGPFVTAPDISAAAASTT